MALVAIARAVQHQQLRARGYGDTADQILRNAPVFLIIAWMLGGYAGATVLAVMPGGPRSPSLRTALARLGLLAAYAAMSGLLGALLIGPALGGVAGYNARWPG